MFHDLTVIARETWRLRRSFRPQAWFEAAVAHPELHQALHRVNHWGSAWQACSWLPGLCRQSCTTEMQRFRYQAFGTNNMSKLPSINMVATASIRSWEQFWAS
jgi:hypothetical protein